METKPAVDKNERKAQLHAIARGYVTEGLGKGNFDAIPYAADVSLRAPLAPGGSTHPLKGRENLRTVWWAPLPALVAGVVVVESYVNEDLTRTAVEFHLQVTNPACTLRILDRFTVNEEGEIVQQENYFDPRDVTNSGWRDQ